MNQKVNFYFEMSKKWQQELKLLRITILDCGLQEELKWGVPCYALVGEGAEEKSKKSANVCLIHAFKDYCAILFFKGALMKDAFGILIQQTENVQAARQLRFTSVEEVINKKATLKTYIFEAIEIERSGLKVVLKNNSDFEYPEELKQKFNQDAPLKAAFAALTPGRQRAYTLYFSGAKQAATREARIEKYRSKILEGRGLNN